MFVFLGIENKEVLICRLLGDLLDPNGAHGMGSVPLKKFLVDGLGQELSEEEISHAEVILKERIDGERRADIVIHLDHLIIPNERFGVSICRLLCDQPEQQFF